VRGPEAQDRHVTTARSVGMAGHLDTSTAGTITRIEDFFYTPPGAEHQSG
jgi:hypothetical protein